MLTFFTSSQTLPILGNAMDKLFTIHLSSNEIKHNVLKPYSDSYQSIVLDDKTFQQIKIKNVYFETELNHKNNYHLLSFMKRYYLDKSKTSFFLTDLFKKHTYT